MLLDEARGQGKAAVIPISELSESHADYRRGDRPLARDPFRFDAAYLPMNSRWRLRCASAALAVALQLCLIVFGIVRTDTVVHVNHLYPFADKVWHLLWYGGVSVLLWIALEGRPLAVLAILAAFGVLDEGVQALTPGRSAEVADLAMDVAAGCGVVGVLSWMRALSPRRAVRELT